MLVIVHDSCDVPHVRVARLPVIAIIIVDRDRSSLRTLFAPPLAALDALPSALDSDVEWRLLTAAWGCLPASCRMTKFGRITTGGILGGDTAQLLGGVHENVINFFPSTGPACGVQVARSRPRGEPIDELGARRVDLVTIMGPRARS
jgi:hypothetical protein